MRRDGFSNQTDSAGEQDEHYYRVEKACRSEIDLQIHQYARADDDDTRE